VLSILRKGLVWKKCCLIDAHRAVGDGKKYLRINLNHSSNISEGFYTWPPKVQSSLHPGRNWAGDQQGYLVLKKGNFSRLRVRKLLVIDPCSSPAQFRRRHGRGCVLLRWPAWSGFGGHLQAVLVPRWRGSPDVWNCNTAPPHHTFTTIEIS